MKALMRERKQLYRPAIKTLAIVVYFSSTFSHQHPIQLRSIYPSIFGRVCHMLLDQLLQPRGSSHKKLAFCKLIRPAATQYHSEWLLDSRGTRFIHIYTNTFRISNQYFPPITLFCMKPMSQMSFRATNWNSSLHHFVESISVKFESCETMS